MRKTIRRQSPLIVCCPTVSWEVGQVTPNGRCVPTRAATASGSWPPPATRSARTARRRRSTTSPGAPTSARARSTGTSRTGSRCSRRSTATRSARSAPAGQALAEHEPPREALADWLHMQFDYIKARRGLGTAVKQMLGTDSATMIDCKTMMRVAIGDLLARAQDDGRHPQGGRARRRAAPGARRGDRDRARARRVRATPRVRARRPPRAAGLGPAARQSFRTAG